GAGNTLTLTGLSAGSDYELKVKDFCKSDVMTKTFTVDPSIVSLIQDPITVNNPTCLENNAGNGSISITMSPNLPNVTYRYSLNASAVVEGGNTYTFNNLTPANHNLVVTTSNNCAQFETSVLLSSPPAFTVGGVASPINPTCSNSSDGRINLPGLTKSSGTVKYSYELINNATLQIVSTQNNLTASSYQIPTNLAAGTYRLTVNDQCLNNAVVYTENNLTITNPFPISITSVADVALACYDEQTARTFTVSNGTPTYWINVSKNGTSLPGYPKTSEPSNVLTTLTNLSVDKVNSYTINVTENCSDNSVVDVVAAESFLITSTADSPLLMNVSHPLYINNFDLTCPESNDGRISVLVSGGVRSGADADAYHVYLLSASDVVLVDNDGGTATTSSNTYGSVAPGVGEAGAVRFNISGLAAGTYHVMVRDKNTVASISPVYCEKRVNNIILTAPLPLTISNPNFANDLDNEVLFGGDVYVRCKDDASITYRT
ncbi:MAG: hypothetical protein O9262_08435, partial [Cyclobacteriaceae bacterium]|nr:hypothetical protein [Cyclobacteriaceae bacterium]